MAEKAPEEEDIDAVKTAPQHRWSDDHPKELEIKPKPVVVKKTVLSLIDDSDEEGDILSKSSLEVNKIINSLTNHQFPPWKQFY